MCFCTYQGCSKDKACVLFVPGKPGEASVEDGQVPQCQRGLVCLDGRSHIPHISSQLDTICWRVSLYKLEIIAGSITL